MAKIHRILAVLSAKGLRWMDIPPAFFSIFTKGDNFSDFLDNKAPQEWDLLLKERIRF